LFPERPQARRKALAKRAAAKIARHCGCDAEKLAELLAEE
jgi:hypothetical protein